MQWIALRWQPEEDRAPVAATAPMPGAPAADTPVAAPPSIETLGWWALQFTPRVTWLDEALLLEVSACERLWGGQQSLMRLMTAWNPAFFADCALAPSSMLAAFQRSSGATSRRTHRRAISAMPRPLSARATGWAMVATPSI